MAGSIKHTMKSDGSFTMDLIENMGDAHEALQEYHQALEETVDMLDATAGIFHQLIRHPNSHWHRSRAVTRLAKVQPLLAKRLRERLGE